MRGIHRYVEGKVLRVNLRRSMRCFWISTGGLKKKIYDLERFMSIPEAS
jgi:hypothetical protein